MNLLRSLRRHDPDQVRRVTRRGGTLSQKAPLLARSLECVGRLGKHEPEVGGAGRAERPPRVPREKFHLPHLAVIFRG